MVRKFPIVCRRFYKVDLLTHDAGQQKIVFYLLDFDKWNDYHLL